MSSPMIFRGTFVFESQQDLESALDYFSATEIGKADFTIDGLTATINWDGSGPYFIYEEMTPAIEQAADHAIGGSIECQFDGDEVWMIATKPIPYTVGFSLLMRDVIGEDWTGVEFSRDALTTEHLPEAVNAYNALSTWPQKSALIQLIQDKIAPVTKPIMLDFLDAPAYDADDTIWLSKAVALCHLSGSFDAFDRYLNLGNAGVETEAAKVKRVTLEN